MNKFFYDKHIEVWKKAEQVHIGAGAYEEGEPMLLYVDTVDIQPTSAAQVKKEYGFDIEVTHEMYSDKNDIEIGEHLVVFKDNTFEVKHKITWDTYTEYLLEMK